MRRGERATVGKLKFQDSTLSRSPPRRLSSQFLPSLESALPLISSSAFWLLLCRFPLLGWIFCFRFPSVSHCALLSPFGTTLRRPHGLSRTALRVHSCTVSVFYFILFYVFEPFGVPPSCVFCSPSFSRCSWCGFYFEASLTGDFLVVDA